MDYIPAARGTDAVVGCANEQMFVSTGKLMADAKMPRQNNLTIFSGVTSGNCGVSWIRLHQVILTRRLTKPGSLALALDLGERFVKAGHAGGHTCRAKDSLTPRPRRFERFQDYFDLLAIGHTGGHFQLDGITMHDTVYHDAHNFPSKARSFSAVTVSLRRSPKMTSYRPSSSFHRTSTLSLSLGPTVLP